MSTSNIFEDFIHYVFYGHTILSYCMCIYIGYVEWCKYFARLVVNSKYSRILTFNFQFFSIIPFKVSTSKSLLKSFEKSQSPRK